jgi:hypothetical protein
MRRTLVQILVGALIAAACSSPASHPIQIDEGLLTVDNRTPHDWSGVEIWINRQYRVTVPRIAARTRFTTTLDVFVAGFGQRFDRRRQRIDEVRLTAREPDGTGVDLHLENR